MAETEIPKRCRQLLGIEFPISPNVKLTGARVTPVAKKRRPLSRVRYS